jgi:HEAT repeat protein
MCPPVQSPLRDRATDVVLKFLFGATAQHVSRSPSLTRQRRALTIVPRRARRLEVVSRLEHPSADVRAAAVAALGALGDIAVDFVPDITLLLYHARPETRAAAVDALRTVDHGSERKFDRRLMWRSSQNRLFELGKLQYS